MNTVKETQPKRLYTNPQIVQITLDNEISLSMESFPPGGPFESRNIAPEHFNNNPFEKTIG